MLQQVLMSTRHSLLLYTSQKSIYDHSKYSDNGLWIYEAFFCSSAPVHWCTNALVHRCTICNSLGNQHHTHSRRLCLYKRNLINLWTLACGQPTWFNHHLVSSVGRVPVCQAGGHGFKPRPDQQSGSLNNWEESAAFVMTPANGQTF